MFQQTNQGLCLSIKVIPKASRSEVVGWEGEVLKIRLAALPEKGEANSELIRFLAHYFGLPKSGIKLVQGETSRRKKVSFLGTPASLLEDKLKSFKES